MTSQKSPSFPLKCPFSMDFLLAQQLGKKVKIKSEDIMELIPIIKLSLVIFATVVFFIVLISYMIYKAKEKRSVRPWDKKNERENNGKSHSAPIYSERALQRSQYSELVNKELLQLVPQRETRRVPVLAHAEPRSRERFKVVNEEQLNYKIYQTRVEKQRAFYHPSDETVKSFSFTVPTANILDSYSLPNEPLRKLALK